MNRFIPIIIGTLAITACGSKTYYVTNTEAPNSSVEVVNTTDAPKAPQTVATPSNSDEDMFLEYMYQEQSFFINQPPKTSDSQMLETANMCCEYLQDGSLDITQIVDAMVGEADNLETQDFFASLLFGAINYLCPDQMWQIENLD